MLKAPRRARIAAAATASSLFVARRHIHRHHSPDRNYSQQIQDRQNTFQWSSRHVFRPHQHFSYDPSSWSRKLEEKVKQQLKLSLVERVRLAAEHEAERTANKAAIQHAPAGALQSSPSTAVPDSGEEDLPSYFFSADDVSLPPARGAPSEDIGAPVNAWDEVPLQELIEEVQRLQHLLHRRRYAGNASLARRRHQTEEFRTVLCHLLDRLSEAVLGTSVTVDACAYGWFALLQSVEPLAEALAARMAENVGHEAAPQAAVHNIFAALHAGLLLPMETGGVAHTAAAAGSLSLEALIEVFSIATCPFVRNCTEVFSKVALSPAAVADYANWVGAAAQERARDEAGEAGEGGGALREWVDPQHLQAWAVATRLLHRRSGDSSSPAAASTVAHLLPPLILHVGHAALYVTRTLENVTGATLRGRVRESLQRGLKEKNATAEDEREGEDGVLSPKAVVLDVTASPRGVQVAPTACDDVCGVLSAATAVLLVAAQTNSQREGAEEARVLRLVTTCLRMMAHAPNYDVEGTAVVPWACALLQTGVLLPLPARIGQRDGRRMPEGTEDGVRLSLRLVLLLSRLSFTDVVERASLGRLVLLLTQWPEPEGCTATERAEWRRLRGVVMRHVLERVSCEDLAEAAAGLEGAPSWVEAIALGEYDGAVPTQLWRAACEHWLPTVPVSHTPLCTPSIAEALLLLCERLRVRDDAGRSVGSTNLRSLQTAGLVARCVAVMRGEPQLAEALLRSADAWEAAGEGLSEHLQGLLVAMQAVVRRECAQTKVMNF